MRANQRDLELEQRILTLAETEKNASTIAAAIPCSPHHARKTLRRHGLYVKASRPPATKRKRVLELARQHEDWSCEKIAEVAGCAGSYARCVMIDAKVNTVRCRKFYKRWTSKELAQVQDLIDRGISKPRIAHLLNLPEQRVVDVGTRYEMGACLRPVGRKARAWRMLAAGADVKTVAGELGLHIDTVRKYRKNMPKYWIKESKRLDNRENAE